MTVTAKPGGALFRNQTIVEGLSKAPLVRQIAVRVKLVEPSGMVAAEALDGGRR